MNGRWLGLPVILCRECEVTVVRDSPLLLSRRGVVLVSEDQAVPHAFGCSTAAVEVSEMSQVSRVLPVVR